MKTKWLAVAAAMIFNSSVALAGEAENKIFSVSNGFKARYLSDSGAIKLAFLEAENMVLGVFGGGTKCTSRRAGDLSRAYRGVLDAVAGADAKAIYAAAANLDYHAHKRSKMYTKCWNHMVGQSRVLGGAADLATQVVAIGTEAGW